MRLRGQSSASFGPPIQGLGNSAGPQFQTEQHGYMDLAELQTMTDQLVQEANADPDFAGVFTLYRAHTPQLFVDIDRAKVQSLLVPIQKVFTTLQVYMGGYYVNQFNKFGRTWQVNIEADPGSRTVARRPQAALCTLRTQRGAGADDSAGHTAGHRGHYRPRVGHALQHVPVGHGQRKSGPWRQLRHRHAGNNATGAASWTCRSSGLPWPISRRLRHNASNVDGTVRNATCAIAALTAFSCSLLLGLGSGEFGGMAANTML